MKKWIVGSENYLLIFSFLYVIKMIIVHQLLFNEISFFKILIVELIPIFTIYLLVELFFDKKRFLVYFFINIFLSIFLFSALIYNDYYNSIITYHVLTVVSQAMEVSDVIVMITNFKYLLVFSDTVLMIIFWKFLRKKTKNNNKRKKWFIVVNLLFFVFLNTFFFFNKLDEKVISEKGRAKEVGLFHYQFAFLVPEKKSFTNEKVTSEKIKDIRNVEFPNNVKYQGVVNGKHLIVVQLESFQNFVVDLKVEGQEITPVLNKLLEESLYFSNFYQQVGRGNTSDAEFVMNTSILPIGEEAVSLVYGDRDFPSLPKLLKDYDYESATFHTNEVEFWNREELYQSLGFDKFYDKKYYGEEDVIAFGSSDEQLYKKSIPILENLLKNNKKIYAHMVAMSSHNPFVIPEHMRGLDFSKKFEDSVLEDYFQSIWYSDMALGKFIEELKKLGIWEETLFVVYGDHFGLATYTLSQEERDLLSDLIGRQYIVAESVNVPLIIRVPGVERKEIEIVGGFVDILPTISNLLGISLDNFIHFGQDLLNVKENFVSQIFYMNKGTFIYDDKVFEVGSGFEDGTLKLIEDFSNVEKTDRTKEIFDKNLKLIHMSENYVESLPFR